MSDNIKITGSQSIANPTGDFSQVSFNLEAIDDFVKGNGVQFEHHVAIPSPIGLKERGDIRKTELLDSLESNGMLYKKVGVFNAVLLGNGHNKSNVDGGQLDNSSARITLPRFYNDGDKTIHLAAGDRLFVKDLEIKIANYQKVEYNGRISDFLQFPALDVEFLVDSLGNEYEQGKHFNLDKNGNICWIVGEASPGIDLETGKGRVYAIRYLYTAFFYVVELINEVRIGRITEGDERVPARMGYQAHICREFVYHNRIKPADDDVNIKKEDNRTLPKPVEALDESKNKIKISLRDFE
jgi:hypothetical protein